MPDGSPEDFLSGDFNAVPSSRLIRRLTAPHSARFIDAARAAPSHLGPVTTFHWGTGTRRLGLTLDYILARGRSIPKRVEVLEVHDGRLYPSDHHPVVVEFSEPAES